MHNRWTYCILLFFPIVFFLYSCTSYKTRKYQNQKVKIVSEYPTTEKVECLFLSGDSVATDVRNYSWKRNAIQFWNIGSKKQTIDLVNIDSMTFAGNKTMILIPKQTIKALELFLFDKTNLRPQQYEWRNQVLYYSEKRNGELTEIVPLYTIDSMTIKHSQYKSPGFKDTLLFAGFISYFYIIYNVFGK